MKAVKSFFSICIIVLLVIFAVQNFDSTTIDFFNWSITLPLAITIVVIYVLGMLTGGMLWSAIKRAVKSPKKDLGTADTE